MTCVSPPPLTDGQLWAYVDGEADHEVATHIERCPHCRERARRLAELQERLMTKLFRATCPAPEELGEYHLGLLSHEQAAAVAQHVDICPHCAREAAQLEQYLADLAPALELSVLERAKEEVRVLIARLIDGGKSTPPWLAPAPAGLRGEEAGTYAYQAGEVEMVIEVQEDAEHPDRKVILGLIMGVDEPGRMQVHVWHADELLSTVPVDELGNFIVSNLAAAPYELILSGPGVEIHIQNLEVGATQ